MSKAYLIDCIILLEWITTVVAMIFLLYVVGIENRYLQIRIKWSGNQFTRQKKMAPIKPPEGDLMRTVFALLVCFFRTAFQRSVDDG